MQIGIIKETAAGETRVAATPETVKKMAAIPGISVVIESGAGIGIKPARRCLRCGGRISQNERE